MKKLGLIGYPIAHSQSPALFRERFGDSPEAGTYDLIETPDFGEASRIFLEHYDAVNVTAPFKEKAFRLAGHCDASGAMSMALNLLVKEKDGTVSGWNTDLIAVRQILGRILSGRKGTEPLTVLVAGMGGAGKSAAAAALMQGCRVILANRTQERTQSFLDHISSDYPDYIPQIKAVCSLSEVPVFASAADVIVFTLPLKIEEKILVGLAGKYVIEANYREPSADMETARRLGFHYIGGLEWLRLQADAGYDIIFGRESFLPETD